MNDEHEVDDDAGVEEFLKPLRQVGPSPAGQAENRSAVSRELQKLEGEVTQLVVPWWRRRVSLPLPAAVALAAMLVASFTWAVVQGTGAPQDEPRRRPITPSAPSSAPVQLASVAPRAAALEYYQTNTYVLGVGVISSETSYLVQE